MTLVQGNIKYYSVLIVCMCVIGISVFTCLYLITHFTQFNMYILTGPVIIRSSGGDVEDGSVINAFVVNETDTELSLTCTSVFQNEIVEWIRLNMAGNVEQEQSNDSHLSTISFALPSDDFNSTFRCKSNNTLLYKDVFITNRK